jgi:hypothetical protein
VCSTIALAIEALRVPDGHVARAALGDQQATEMSVLRYTRFGTVGAMVAPISS